MNAQQKEMLLRSQEQQENQGRLIEALRKLPATRRFTFYLDPSFTMPCVDWIRATEPTRC